MCVVLSVHASCTELVRGDGGRITLSLSAEAEVHIPRPSVWLR